MGSTEHKADQAEIERLEEHASALRKVLSWECSSNIINIILLYSEFFPEPVGNWCLFSHVNPKYFPNNLF